jgi:hypothetical protein
VVAIYVASLVDHCCHFSPFFSLDEDTRNTFSVSIHIAGAKPDGDGIQRILESTKEEIKKQNCSLEWVEESTELILRREGLSIDLLQANNVDEFRDVMFSFVDTGHSIQKAVEKSPRSVNGRKWLGILKRWKEIKPKHAENER